MEAPDVEAADARAADVAAAPGCPLCAAPSPRLHHADAAREYLRCARCALVFLRPADRVPPLAEVMRYLEHRNSGDDPGYVEFLSRLADPVAGRLAAGARGLDFGCGPAPVLARILGDRGFPCVSYDPLFHPDERALDARYDFVTCSEVIEHVHEPRALLDRFARLLVPGGVIGIMTRFHGLEAPFARWWYRRDPTHVCFYDATTMRWIAAAYGWTLEIPRDHVALFRTGHAAPAGGNGGA